MNSLVIISALVAVMAAVAVQEARADCWDTGCQPNSWKVVGCAQYGRVEKGKKPCPGGFIYTCCTSVSRTVPAHPECAGETRCLHKSLAADGGVDGCEKMDKKLVKEMKNKPCQKGDVYSCCAHRHVTVEHHHSTTAEPDPVSPSTVPASTPEAQM